MSEIRKLISFLEKYKDYSFHAHFFECSQAVFLEQFAIVLTEIADRLAALENKDSCLKEIIT